MIKTEIIVKRTNEKSESVIRSIDWQDLNNGFCGDIVISFKDGIMVGNKVLHQSLTWSSEK